MTQDPDLAYLKDIAESGRSSPLLGGRFFVWWGGLATAALLAHWLVITGRIGMETGQVGLIWIAYGVIGTLGSIVLARGIRAKPGVGSHNNRAESAVWRAVSFAIAAYALGTVLARLLGAGELILFDTIPLVAIAGYGIAFSVTAAMGGPKWMQPLSWLAWIAAGLGLALTGTPALYLYTAAMVLVLALLPGLILLRAEPAADA